MEILSFIGGETAAGLGRHTIARVLDTIMYALSMYDLSGSRFLRPQEIVPPRIAEFGVSYSF